MTILNELFPAEQSVAPAKQGTVLEIGAASANVQALPGAAPARGTTNSTDAEPQEDLGPEVMERQRRDAVLFLLERIARNELITEDELRKKMGVNRKWIGEAVKANRLFYVRTPAGEHFYPAFYGDPAYERQALEVICEKLGQLPGDAKYQFFTRKSISLDILTPLEALKEGKLAKILIVAQRVPSVWRPWGPGAEATRFSP